MNLSLAAELLDEVLAHAKAAYPLEGCGLLAGVGGASRFIAMENVLASPTSYEMDPGRLIAALRDLRERGEQLAAIYHSHPSGPAHPSKSDIEQACYPDAAYLIISLADPEHPIARAFRIVDGKARDIELHVIV